MNFRHCISTYLCDNSKRFFYASCVFSATKGYWNWSLILRKTQETCRRKIAYISCSFFFHQSSVFKHAPFSTERRRILRKQSAELVFFSIGVIRGAASVSLLVKCAAKCSEASCTLAELRGNDHRGKRPSLFFPSNSAMMVIFVICNNNGCYFDAMYFEGSILLENLA